VACHIIVPRDSRCPSRGLVFVVGQPITELFVPLVNIADDFRCDCP